MDVHVNEQERLILHLDTTKVKEVTIADLHFSHSNVLNNEHNSYHKTSVKWLRAVELL